MTRGTEETSSDETLREGSRSAGRARKAADGASRENAASTSTARSGLFANYKHDPRFFDEMFDDFGAPWPHCQALAQVLGATTAEEIGSIQVRAERMFHREGITFSITGDDGAQERIIPIDCLPRALSSEEWSHLERGLQQRLEALNLFLCDVYGPARILADGVVPTDLVFGCPQYRVQMRGFVPPHGTFVSVCGTDLVRTRDGFLVLEDNLRVPSGVSYMLANRRVVKTSFRNVYRRMKVRDIDHYGQLLRTTLEELAPSGIADPCIVLLTPGVYNSAFYEHMFLAREMGVELVEGGDLLVYGEYVYMRTTKGLRRVDVIYRRVDDDFIDPLAFRTDSQLGTPGLFHAYRRGRVVIANAPGTGVADDKAVYAYVHDMIRYYLAEEPILQNVETYLCRNPADLEYTLDNLDKLVVKRVGESGGVGMLVGPQSTPAERENFAAQLRAYPSDYISQPTLDLSRAPCHTPDGAAPRHVDLRPFVLRGQKTRLVPGAFCRVALKEGSLVVNSSQGGGGKDLWVLCED